MKRLKIDIGKWTKLFPEGYIPEDIVLTCVNSLITETEEEHKLKAFLEEVLSSRTKKIPLQRNISEQEIQELRVTFEKMLSKYKGLFFFTEKMPIVLLGGGIDVNVDYANTHYHVQVSGEGHPKNCIRIMQKSEYIIQALDHILSSLEGPESKGSKIGETTLGVGDSVKSIL